MRETAAEIVKGSISPLSIIIIGIGSANFENMQILDGDDVRLTNPMTGEAAKRDIVQFVEFNKYKESSKLVEEVLHEIPDQIQEFFMSCEKFIKLNNS